MSNTILNGLIISFLILIRMAGWAQIDPEKVTGISLLLRENSYRHGACLGV